MDILNYLTGQKRIIDLELEKILSPTEGLNSGLTSMMHYAVFPGGKRIRPILALAAAEAIGSSSENLLYPACAVELVHCYSLVHDDLPAMDDDDLRRGKPTVHKVVGEGIAILVGDALLTLAFEVITAGESLPCDTRVRLAQELAAASGRDGIVGGQVVDLQSEGKKIDIDTLQYIHGHKTADLITAAIRIGAIAGKADPQQLSALTDYSQSLGLLFQIVDDILDVTGNIEKLGKQAGADEKQRKATYPAVAGLDRSRWIADQLAGKAEAAIAGLDHRAEPLREIIGFVLERDK